MLKPSGMAMRQTVRYRHRTAVLAAAVAFIAACTGPDRPASDSLTAATNADDRVSEPAGYRLADYRAPVPDTVAGGTTVATTDVERLIAEGGIVLVDVLPYQGRPENLPAETLWIPKPRNNIPGSVWLPETGRGELSPAVEGYFSSNLERLSEGRRDRALLFYCLAECWMSWNAAKRAIGYGYTNVYWYPDGTDGWTATGLPVERSEPVPLPADAPAS